MQCAICKGRGFCGKACPILAKLRQFQPKVKTEFSGSSPPEIFVGRLNYPYVNMGILSPNFYGENEKLAMPEEWFKAKSSISDILSYRSSLIYSKFSSSIKNGGGKFLEIMKEVAMSSKSASMEFKLKHRPLLNARLDSRMPLIGNPALLKYARIEENLKVHKKVDYIVSDSDVKSSVALKELYKHKISVSHIIKLLSAGLLGLKSKRKLVPTRWAITAVDSKISEDMIKEIKYFPSINSYLVFHSEYLGNHYEILMIPKEFSFEVIEAKLAGSIWNPSDELEIMKDYENWKGRKEYAFNVGGGYYAARLPIAEYLMKIKRQASVLIFRECREEYYAPCGVGILREICKDALSKKPEVYYNLEDSFKSIAKRIKLPLELFKKESKLLFEIKHQKNLDFFIKS